MPLGHGLPLQEDAADGDLPRRPHARKLGPADEKEFSKAWMRCNRKLDKKEADLDPGSAAEFIDRETGEVLR